MTFQQTPSPAERVETIIDYRFTDRALLLDAMTLPGLGWHDNRRLAIVGDAVMDAAMAERWYLQGQGRGM
jgi:dsRNA-specific ribonuclease